LGEAGIDEWPVRRDLHAHTQEATRSQLGDEAFAAAYAEGGRMSVEEAVRYALTTRPTDPPVAVAGARPGADREGPAPTAGPSARRVAGGLTPREVEVARLVAEGKTNREIAEALVLSERTVSTHLDHIFAKLDVSSRTAVAAFALRHGLA
jgi:DNA-binding NarL/FixJ family response regulator